MTEINERMQYRAAGAFGADGTAASSDAATRSLLVMNRERVNTDSQAEAAHRAMEQYGITPLHKTVYAYKAHVYDRLADARAYARLDSARESP